MSSNNALIRSITIYAGFPIFIGGTLGNLLNVRFLWRTRHNPCAFIFLISSCINCIVLFYGLLTRILSIGFNLDWSTKDLIWCKTRLAFTQASTSISLSCICLASIDRFLVSCRQDKYRKLSKLSTARLAVIIIIIFWLCHSIPYLVYAELLTSLTTGLISCSFVPNKEFTNYRIYVTLPIYTGLFPSLILAIIGIMTYKNTNKLQISRQRQLVQKQLTSMMLMQIPILFFTILPYIAFTEYTLLTTTMIKSQDKKNIENLFANIFPLIFYITFACPFFVFFASSKSFRQEAKMFFSCQLFINHRVQPQSTTTTRNIQGNLPAVEK
ncbi:unnamed protein product [Rotaria sp. Silwood1]|nr:unnamed protein product [Rotaria sp. Silwood1]CAF1485451.1 unnamed protein product [Rotaria sp. Silwood1]CAF3699830.1 unnamed protein product [Rotaria sp. Silwood1]CAF3714959.1 unnamed protein product [Rotaria sp. Silwood1]CAF4993549.1 unnamed protein product [Rotaria sp. Silwood1]